MHGKRKGPALPPSPLVIAFASESLRFGERLVDDLAELRGRLRAAHEVAVDHERRGAADLRVACSLRVGVDGGLVRVRVEGGVVTDARVAFGSVGPTPLRARSVEAALLGRPVDPGAADLASRDVTPLDDIRSTAEYRRAVCVSTLRAFLASIAPA